MLPQRSRALHITIFQTTFFDATGIAAGASALDLSPAGMSRKTTAARSTIAKAIGRQIVNASIVILRFARHHFTVLGHMAAVFSDDAGKERLGGHGRSERPAPGSCCSHTKALSRFAGYPYCGHRR